MGTKLLFLLLLGAPAWSQGFLPAGSSRTVSVERSSAPVPVGGHINNENVLVKNSEGQIRTLLSYKTALEILVVSFISQDCPADEKPWRILKGLEERYAGWRVAFVAVTPKTQESLTPLQADFKRRRLNWPLSHDPGGLAAKALMVTQLPTVVLVDESGFIRYRGPIEKTEEALKNLIGHVDPIRDPEPLIQNACGDL